MHNKPVLKTGNFADPVQKPLSRGLRIYQKIAILFVFVAFFLLLAVLYLSISQATVTITPNPQVVSTTVSAEIATNASAVGQVEGLVVQENVTKAKIFWLPEEGATALEAKAGGSVTLINETDADQPLVATTRLLSKEGVLFRLDQGETIPAKGELEVVVHADKPGILGEIGPTQFTIPGLPDSKQSVIYAVSVEKMEGGVSYVRVLSQADLDQAGDALKDEVLEETKELLRSRVTDTNVDGEMFDVEIVERKSDTDIGKETGSFTISLTARVTGVFYKSEDLASFAETSLYNQTGQGFQVSSVKKDGLQVTLQSVDPDRGVATINAYLDGFALIAQNNEMLDKAKFTGRSAGEIITLLEATDAIQNVEVTFTPFWLKRVPTLQDHIKVIVQ